MCSDLKKYNKSEFKYELAGLHVHNIYCCCGNHLAPGGGTKRVNDISREQQSISDRRRVYLT